MRRLGLRAAPLVLALLIDLLSSHIRHLPANHFQIGIHREAPDESNSLDNVIHRGGTLFDKSHTNDTLAS